MPDYVRPHIDDVAFYDEAGAVIPYGTRWAHLNGIAPEEAYSVDPHPERFAPLHTVATALIDHLIATYDVAAEEGYAVTDGLQHVPPPKDVVRAVRLTPASALAAPVTFVFTNYPGVRLNAGALFVTSWPSCGCDACDETWQAACDDLEWQVLTIVGGGLSEEIGAPRKAKIRYDRGHGFVKGFGQTVSYRIEAGGNMQGGEGAVQGFPKAILEAAAAKLGAISASSPDGNWLPWVRREA